MLAQTSLPKVPLENIVDRILAFRLLTPFDQQLIQSALLSNDFFSEQDHLQISRVCDAVRNGLIWIAE